MYKRKRKQYVCPICDKDFDKESQLKRHMKDSHNLDMKDHLQNNGENNARS